jgi:hypothetical protein
MASTSAAMRLEDHLAARHRLIQGARHQQVGPGQLELAGMLPTKPLPP